MTEVVPAGGTGSAVDVFDPDLMVGLEDISTTDLVIPRLQIVHTEGKLKDTLSNAVFDSLDVVLLGQVKQRVMFHPTVDDGDKPMCKSPDFEHGFPNNSEETPSHKRFPWERSGFDPANFPPEKGLNGHVTLPCASCPFKEWPKDRGEGDGKPPCAEQWTFPLLYSPGDGLPYQLALFSVQKSGIPPAKKYLTSFVQANTPLFVARTRLTLRMAVRGSVTYSTPVFSRLEETPRNEWREYAQQARTIRDFVRQPPRPADDDEGGFVSAASAAAPAAAAPSAAPATAAPATPAAPAAPVAAATAPVVSAPAAVPAATAAPVGDPADDLPF